MNRPALTGRKKRIGDIHCDGGFITTGARFSVAPEAAFGLGKKTGQVLIKQGSVSPDALATALSFQFGLPVADLKHIHIDPEAVRLVPKQQARQYNPISLSLNGDLPRVAIYDPSDPAAPDTLATITGRQIRPVLSARSGIEEKISNRCRRTSNIQKHVENVVTRQNPGRREVTGASGAETLRSAAQTSKCPAAFLPAGGE